MLRECTKVEKLGLSFLTVWALAGISLHRLLSTLTPSQHQAEKLSWKPVWKIPVTCFTEAGLCRQPRSPFGWSMSRQGERDQPGATWEQFFLLAMDLQFLHCIYRCLLCKGDKNFQRQYRLSGGSAYAKSWVNQLVSQGIFYEWFGFAILKSLWLAYRKISTF